MVPEDSGELHGIGTTVLSHGLEAIDLKRIRLTVCNRLLGTSILLILIALGVVILGRAGFAFTRDIAAMLSIVLGIDSVWSQAGALERWRSIGFLTGITSGIILLPLEAPLFVAQGDPLIILLRGDPIGATIVMGVLSVFAPLWLRTSKNLSVSQAQQVRDTKRADITAHLRDSVPQTLTLIHASAEDPRRVRILAFSEERELCFWFYTGRPKAVSSFAEVVRQSVSALGSKFGVPARVATVSDVESGPAELILVVAPGETVTNTLRHGNPPVSVYLEARMRKTEVFIKDYGNGFDLDFVPRGRYGVRDSIISRMERIGGKTHIRVRSSSMETALEVSRKAENIPHDAPNITHDALNIPHDVPNTQGAS